MGVLHQVGKHTITEVPIEDDSPLNSQESSAHRMYKSFLFCYFYY